MKFNIRYNMLKGIIPLTMLMAGCSKDNNTPGGTEPEPTPTTVKQNISTVIEMKNLMAAQHDSKTTYEYTIANDLAADSTDVAETLASYKVWDDAASNITTAWGANGIYPPADKTILTFDAWDKSGKPTPKLNATTGWSYYSYDESDSTKIEGAGGPALPVKRNIPDGPKEPGLYELNNTHEAKAKLSAMEGETEPFIIKLANAWDIRNGDPAQIARLMDLMKQTDPLVTVQGNLSIVPYTDSIATNVAFFEQLKNVNGQILSANGKYFFVENVGDASFVDAFPGVTFRTQTSVDFANIHIIPNVLDIRTVDRDFAAKVLALPKRTGFATSHYKLKTNNVPLYIKDIKALERISLEPNKVVGTKEFQNPDIVPTDGYPQYSDILMQGNGHKWQRGMGHAVGDRINKSNGVTKLRTTEPMNGPGKIERYAEDVNKILMSLDGTNNRTSLTVIYLNDIALPINHPILSMDEGTDLPVFQYEISAREYAFVLSAEQAAQLDMESTNPIVQIQNNLKVMAMFGNNIALTNPITQGEGGPGALSKRKSFVWVTPAEWAAYQEAGKIALQSVKVKRSSVASDSLIIQVGTKQIKPGMDLSTGIDAFFEMQMAIQVQGKTPVR